MTETSPATATKDSAWSPFRYAAFTVIWAASVVSNIGTWMYNAASGWLMTDLNPDPLVVSLVQVATTLPMFLFALPAGAMADIVDRRRFLLIAETATTLVCVIFAVVVALGLATAGSLLLFTFLIGVGSALTAPAWQAVVPQLVPREHLSPAITANSVGINVSRAVGPALGGVLAAAFGIAVPFWINGLSNLGIVVALFWWRSPHHKGHAQPAERFVGAMRTGLRHTRNNPHLRATLIRAVAFFLFASAYWALLPLVARDQIIGGPELYGVLLGAIGAGAVGGAFALPWLKAQLGPDGLVYAGTIGTAVTLALFGVAREPILALLASLIAGVSWIAVQSSLNVSAQYALPDWVRGRGLAMFVTVFYGAMTVGSALWGQIATLIGLPWTHFITAAGAIAAIPLTSRWKLQTGAKADLTPSMHWPTPVISDAIDHDQGPVLVTVEYHVAPDNRDAFLRAIEKYGSERKRDGAYAWDVFEDVTEPGRFLETFLSDSWQEHLRQHERVTNADRELEQTVRRFQIDGDPKVTHFIAAEADGD